MQKSFLLLGMALVFAVSGVDSQAQTRRTFTAAHVFRGEKTDLLQPLPTISGWADDALYLLINEGKTMSVDAKTGQEIPYTAPATNQVSSKNDDVYLRPATGEEKRLTNNSDREANPTLSPDGRFVAFTRNKELYVVETATGTETKLTNDASETVYNGYAAWLYWEEILGRPTAYKAFWWAPDSKHLAFMRFDESNVPVFPVFNATGQHGTLEKQRYPKAGDPNPMVRMGLVSLNTFKTTWADFDEKADQYFGTPFWTPDGSRLWMQWKNRGQDNLKLYAVDPSSGGKTEVFSETQKTWVDWLTEVNFLGKNQGFILKSDRDGWAQLYQFGPDGTLKTQLTSGNFTVTGVPLVDEKTQTVFFTARKEASTRADLYRVGFDGKDLRRLTFGDYTHQARVSPGGSYFLTTYSNLTTPPKLALLDKNGKLVRELGDSRGIEFERYSLAKSEIVKYPTTDGFNLPMLITYPINLDPARKYPVIISVYGGPNAGTVFDGWKPINATQWWAQEGIIQVAVDHRGSGHLGKMGQNYLHRNLGKWEMTDYIEAVKFLRKMPVVDSTKIMITGGSYGGYVTALALTAGADYFTHGIANYGVMDWSLYDTEYTERFMDTPAENPEGYKASSVLTHADKLKGKLRIVHGTMDDNVHLQNSIQLVDKLQELGKSFEFMAYPGGKHGWGGAKAQHQRGETFRFIYQNLLEKPLPKEVQ
ncbi:MAG: S9 family peptidase [Cytophagaceae bacterium]|nr:S9 family peptidase [Cytophagaceae bacterium]